MCRKRDFLFLALNVFLLFSVLCITIFLCFRGINTKWFPNRGICAFGPGRRRGVLIVYVVSGYVQMGLFGSECVRACSRLCEFVHMFLHGVSKWR